MPSLNNAVDKLATYEIEWSICSSWNNARGS